MFRDTLEGLIGDPSLSQLLRTSQHMGFAEQIFQSGNLQLTGFESLAEKFKEPNLEQYFRVQQAGQHPGVAIVDFDNDGWIDLFVSNGMSRDFMNSDLAASIKNRYGEQWRKAPILKQRNLLFQNRGDLAFREVGRDWGLQNETASYGAALGDLDIDGDLDMVVNNFEAPVSIYRNQ